MSLTQWSAFVEVCRTGSIGGAAATLGYTQSAVSRQVAGLEAELQERLLERLPRGVRPTPAGAALLQHARIVVNEALDVSRRAVHERKAYARHSTTIDLVDVDRHGDELHHTAVWQQVDALPERQRAAVILRYVLDLGEREIAETLGCSQGTVKSQLAKARATLLRGLTDIERPTSRSGAR